MTKLYQLRQLLKTMEAMTPTIASETKGSTTRNELRAHLDYIDDLEKQIEIEEKRENGEIPTIEAKYDE